MHSHNTDRSSQVRRSNGTWRDDEDDYDLTAAAVSDGFRPASATGVSTTPYFSRPPTVSPQNLTPTANVSSQDYLGFIKRPSSTFKPPRLHDSLTLRNDGLNTVHHGQPSVPSRRGLSNPSHPYDMYPQRTMSNATSTTAPHIASDLRSISQGPTHPYSLYTQNTAPAQEVSQEQIPVGFNGVGAAYQRQLGPDGEEIGDLIGPMGHMEELPPYTRYPEQFHANKRSVDAAPIIGTPPVQLIDGAGGIGVATRNPEFSSTREDLAMSRSRPSVRSTMSARSQHDINTAARDTAEKPTMTKWQRRARKKFGGIVPYWAICLLAVALVLLGVVMGAVIGTVLLKHHSSSSDDDDSGVPETEPTPTSTDVVPLTTIPLDLIPLATGYFALPPLEPKQAPNTCFNDTTQADAWSCDMSTHLYILNITIDTAKPETCHYGLDLIPANVTDVTDTNFPWGMWPPTISSSLTLVNDTLNPGYGPAWWLQMVYNKTVLVSDDGFNHNQKRDGSSPWHSVVGVDFAQHGKKSKGAMVGDKPWICTWQDTTIEVFIYPSQNTSQSSSMAGSESGVLLGYSGHIANVPNGKVVELPRVAKLQERRLSDNSNIIATCHQIEIIGSGNDSEPVLSKDGSGPKEIIIKGKTNSLGEKLDERQRYGHPFRRWAEKHLMPRDAGGLTDCGCLWLST